MELIIKILQLLGFVITVVVFKGKLVNAAFFCWAYLYFLDLLVIRYKETQLDPPAKKNVYQTQKFSCFIYGIAFVIIGVIQIIGHLDFPRFILWGSWTNKYVLATRLVWLIVWLLQSYQNFLIESRQVKSKFNSRQLGSNTKIPLQLKVKLIASNFNPIFYVPLSAPIFLSLVQSIFNR